MLDVFAPRVRPQSSPRHVTKLLEWLRQVVCRRHRIDAVAEQEHDARAGGDAGAELIPNRVGGAVDAATTDRVEGAQIERRHEDQQHRAARRRAGIGLAPAFPDRQVDPVGEDPGLAEAGAELARKGGCLVGAVAAAKTDEDAGGHPGRRVWPRLGRQTSGLPR